MELPLNHGLDPNDELYATAIVDRMLDRALALSASDVHCDVNRESVMIKFRIHGRLIAVGEVSPGNVSSIVGRIKAMSGLLTYRSDVPQEGRFEYGKNRLEARVGTLPTLFGERVVIRLAMPVSKPWLMNDLGFSEETNSSLNRAILAPSGVIMIAGPPRSGKTTTAYACVREILAHDVEPRSVVTLEDPIEQTVLGASQSQVQPTQGYNWDMGMRAILRQDPEVLMIGEIRDSETARMVFQSALTGQLVITTLHARSVADALRRLLDMQVPSFHIQSGLRFMTCQRMLQRNDKAESSLVLAESLDGIEGILARAIHLDADSSQLHEAAIAQGMTSFQKQIPELIEQGVLSSQEVQRYFERPTHDTK